MPNSDSSNRITLDELEKRLEANPRFKKMEPNPDETTVTFLGKKAADAFKNQQKK